MEKNKEEICFIENILSNLIKEGTTCDQKNIDDYVELNLNVVRHRIREGKQYMTVRIEEKKREEIQIIFEEEIEMKQYVY